MTEEGVDWNGSRVSTMHRTTSKLPVSPSSPVSTVSHAVSQVGDQIEGDGDHKRLVSYFLQSCALGNKILAAAVVVYKAICFSMIIFHFGWEFPSLLTIEFWPKLK